MSLLFERSTLVWSDDALKQQLAQCANHLSILHCQQVDTNLLCAVLCQQLRTLILENDAIQNLQAISEYLLSNQHLQHLSLKRNMIKDADLQPLALSLRDHAALKCLNLGFNQITTAGTAILCDALQYNTCLQEVILIGNKIDDGKYLSMLQTPKLDLWTNPIGATGIQSLLKHPVTLVWPKCSFFLLICLLGGTKYWEGQNWRRRSTVHCTSVARKLHIEHVWAALIPFDNIGLI